LINLDHEVHTANTFQAALRLARSIPFDIAVIDLGWYTDQTSGIQGDDSLVEMGGFRIADAVRELHPNTQLILYSNRIDMPEVREVAAQKRMLCIQKSFDAVSRQSLVSMVKAFAQLLSSASSIVPVSHAKLERAVRAFLADTTNGCANYDKNVFIMTRFQHGSRELEKIDVALRTTLSANGLIAHRADDRCYPDDRNLWDNVCTYMIGCKYGIAILEDIIQDEFNPNVALEYGFMRGLGKEVLLLKEQRFKPRADIMGTLWDEFDILNIGPDVEGAITRWLRDLGIERNSK
jgi:CheY-like chemotaxis protein